MLGDFAREIERITNDVMLNNADGRFIPLSERERIANDLVLNEQDGRRTPQTLERQPSNHVDTYTNAAAHALAERVAKDAAELERTRTPFGYFGRAPGGRALIADVEEMLSHFRYKPGVELVVRDSLLSGACLLITMKTEDTYNRGHFIEIGKGVPLWFAPTRNIAEFGRWLLEQLKELEEHECREWFRCDGVIFDDPHKNG
jgi:hypothetical protein